MKTGRWFSGWTLAVILLALVIIAGGAYIFIKAQNSPVIEISLAELEDIRGSIYVSGAVNYPGIYPFYAGDTLEDIIRAAGGAKDGAGLTQIELSIDLGGKDNMSQKIDINRAEAWLLEALPGVGEVKAQAVIEYREQHGYFHDINELLNVAGFGETGLEEIKDYITVNE